LSTKLKCLLLDDELPGLSYLKLLCGQLEDVEVTKAFNNPQVFLCEISSLDFDFCILDIELPGINGLQIAALLKDKPVVFTTAYKEYASNAFDLNAVDYVLKPVRKERLQQAVNKVKIFFSGVQKENSFLQLNTDEGKSLIPIDQICYIKVSETDSRDKIIQFKDRTSRTLKNVSFEKLQGLLPSHQFIRVNKSEILSLFAIRSFSFNEVITNIKLPSGENQKLTLSEAYREGFSKKVNL
jgi:DNA-binding LytR/AlgR family response regulator